MSSDGGRGGLSEISMRRGARLPRRDKKRQFFVAQAEESIKFNVYNVVAESLGTDKQRVAGCFSRSRCCCTCPSLITRLDALATNRQRSLVPAKKRRKVFFFLE